MHEVAGAGHGFTTPATAWPDAEKAMFRLANSEGHGQIAQTRDDALWTTRRPETDDDTAPASCCMDELTAMYAPRSEAPARSR